jgi:hypothetical protein
MLPWTVEINLFTDCVLVLPSYRQNKKQGFDWAVEPGLFTNAETA